MNCREFETSWNDLLDARSADVSELEQAIEAHASACGRCRAVSSRYQMLRQAISAWSPPPAASAESLERLYELTVPSTSLVIHHRRSRLARLVPLAAAAALLALAWVGWSARQPGPLGENPAPVSNTAFPAAIGPLMKGRSLDVALAEATEATIDLAREASAPAARIGREILDLDNSKGSALIEEPAVIAADESSASDVIHKVGQRVNAGVKPISGSAHHAFGFLFGPPPGPDPTPAESQGSL
jgi:hypothetical protein